MNTWIHPETGRGFDAGVQNYVDLGNATGFFARMGVPIQPNVRSSNQAVYVDFSTGVKLQNFMPPAANDRSEALRRYLAVGEQLLSILEPGWWNFPPGDSIPSDLLLPFHAFATKYNLTAGLPQIFGTTGFGIPDILNSPTLWVMRSFSVDMLRSILGVIPAFVPVSRRNQDLYDKILNLLKPDVLLSTTVTSATRSASGVTLVVKTSVTGETTRIVAKRLIFTIPPTPANTAPFDLDDAESATLAQFKYSSSYVGIVSHPSLPRNSTLVNTPASAQPANYLDAVPIFPYATRFDNYENSPYYRVIAVGLPGLTESEAKGIITTAFENMVQAGTLNKTDEKLTFVYLESHATVNAHVTGDELRAGFITKLNELQGKRGMWYTGSSWSVGISTSLWVFTDTVLSRVVQGLKD